MTIALSAITSFTGDYEFLSNFSKAGGLVPVEYHFQAAKALVPGQARWVMEAGTPGEAKRRGRQVQILPGWDSQRRVVMTRFVLGKFSVPLLRDKLTATRGRVLIEGNDWGDDQWGAVRPSHAWREAGADLPTWYTGGGEYLVGHNWLGRILMMVRDITAPEA